MEAVWEFILKWLQSLVGADLMIAAIEAGNPIPAQAWLNLAFSSITLLIGILVAYRTFYLVLGLFGKSRRYNETPKDKKYCFLVPARNEGRVIASTIASIRSLDYPTDLIDILVIADNCDEDDQTAKIAAEQGCFVIEHHDPAKCLKGYGLQYAFEIFNKEHDIEKEYFGFVLLDADCVIAKDFLSKLNDCMVESGFDEAVTYCNVRNFDENWISAICGMNVYTRVIGDLRPRSVLASNQQIYGTGCCIRSHLLKDGWTWTGLTEDLEMEADLTAKGYRTGYCEDAAFYVEMPTKPKQFLRQQTRWSRGNILGFFHYAPKLVKSFFKKPTWSKYDIFWRIAPHAFFNFYFTLAYQVLSLILYGIYGDNGYSWASFGTWLATYFLGIYLGALFMDFLSVIREWKKFHLSVPKTILYLLVFPLYNVASLPIYCVAGFMNISWKPIDHHAVNDSSALEDEEARRGGRISPP